MRSYHPAATTPTVAASSLSVWSYHAGARQEEFGALVRSITRPAKGKRASWPLLGRRG